LTPSNVAVAIAAPVGFQLSFFPGGPFVSSLSVAAANGAVPDTTVYVRFAPAAVRTYSGNIVQSGGGADTQRVSVTGSGIPVNVPSVSVLDQSLQFGSVTVGTVSNELICRIQGSSLRPISGTLTVTAPSSFQLSLTSDTGFSSTLILAYSGATLGLDTLFVRFLPQVPGGVINTVHINGGGAAEQSFQVSGSGVLAPVIHAVPAGFASAIDFGSLVFNTLSAPKAILLSAANLEPASGAISLIAPVAYRLSLDPAGAGTTSLSVPYTNGTLAPESLYVAFSPPTSYSRSTDSMLISGGGALPQYLKLQGRGIVPPAIPTTVQLGQNYPNPFNAVTRVPFFLPKAGPAKLMVYNILGQVIAVLNLAGRIGYNEFILDMSRTDYNYKRDFASGIYFYRLAAGGTSIIRKLIFLK
jgi:hypothetical protein